MSTLFYAGLSAAQNGGIPEVRTFFSSAEQVRALVNPAANLPKYKLLEALLKHRPRETFVDIATFEAITNEWAAIVKTDTDAKLLRVDPKMKPTASLKVESDTWYLTAESPLVASLLKNGPRSKVEGLVGLLGEGTEFYSLRNTQGKIGGWILRVPGNAGRGQLDDWYVESPYDYYAPANAELLRRWAQLFQSELKEAGAIRLQAEMLAFHQHPAWILRNPDEDIFDTAWFEGEETQVQAMARRDVQYFIQRACDRLDTNGKHNDSSERIQVLQWLRSLRQWVQITDLDESYSEALRVNLWRAMGDKSPRVATEAAITAGYWPEVWEPRDLELFVAFVVTGASFELADRHGYAIDVKTDEVRKLVFKTRYEIPGLGMAAFNLRAVAPELEAAAPRLFAGERVFVTALQMMNSDRTEKRVQGIRMARMLLTYNLPFPPQIEQRLTELSLRPDADLKNGWDRTGRFPWINSDDIQNAAIDLLHERCEGAMRTEIRPR